MKVEQTECSETSAYKIQTLGNNPEESIQHLLCKPGNVYTYHSPDHPHSSLETDFDWVNIQLNKKISSNNGHCDWMSVQR